MNIPTLPTDNLYKFVAVAGLAAVLAGWIAPKFAYWEYLPEKEAFEAESRRAHAMDREEFDAMGGFTNHPEIVSATERFSNELAASQVQRLARELTPDEMKEVRKDARSKANAKVIVARVIAVNKYHEESPLALALQKKYSDAEQIGRSISYAGLTFCALGFALWWFKVQRFQDQLIKSEAETAQLQLADVRRSANAAKRET